MSLYYNNFKYLDKNSLDQGLIIASFEPDDGFTDSFLSMELIQEDYYDGTKKFDYGARYNTTAAINITVIKSNGADFSLSDVRSLSKWLTGSRINSWLDVGPTRIGHEPDDPNIKYSFLGRVTNLKPRKMDGRTTGYQIEFTSVAPWAFSVPKKFECNIGQLIDVDDEGIVFMSEEGESKFDVDDEGILYVHGQSLSIAGDGTIYMENAWSDTIVNESDDLYTYIYLDIDYKNQNGSWVSIKNASIKAPDGEETIINNVSKDEKITISAKQFIISSIPNKLFGEDFNFVWPRLQPGENNFIIDGDGSGSVIFTYRYPMKVGDCAMDISVYGSNSNCGEMSSYETVKWENIIGAPTTLKGYGITDAYTMDEVDKKLQEIDVNVDVEWNDIRNKPTTIEGYGITDACTTNDVYTKSEIDDRLQEIDVDVEWDDIHNKPTTIGGYGITDAYTTSDVYTKTEVDDKIDDIEISGGGGTGNVYIDEEELNNMLEDILG